MLSSQSTDGKPYDMLFWQHCVLYTSYNSSTAVAVAAAIPVTAAVAAVASVSCTQLLQ
jgi:hypothetical protein